MEIQVYHLVNTDNFGGDYPDESFLSLTDSDGKSNPMVFTSIQEAENIAKAINSQAAFNRYYKVVQQGYKLQGYFEP